MIQAHSTANLKREVLQSSAGSQTLHPCQLIVSQRDFAQGSQLLQGLQAPQALPLELQLHYLASPAVGAGFVTVGQDWACEKQSCVAVHQCAISFLSNRAKQTVVPGRHPVLTQDGKECC